MKEPKLENGGCVSISSSDDSDDEPLEDLFAGNLHRYQALKQQTMNSLSAQSADTADAADPADLGVVGVASALTRVSADPDDGDVDEPNPGQTTTGLSVESVLKELDPDLISPCASPVSKRRCCDDERVRWALEPIPDTDEQPTDIIVNNVKCEKVFEDCDDVLLVTGPVKDDTKKPSLRVIVNVRLGAKLLRLPLYQDELLDTVFERAAQEANVPVSRVCLAFGEHQISANQTPAQIQITSADVLEFWVGSESGTTTTISTSTTAGECGADSVQIKFQSAARRDCVTLAVGREKPLALAMREYADQKRLSLRRLRFKFDGEELKGDETAESLDLEGGECIDVFSV